MHGGADSVFGICFYIESCVFTFSGALSNMGLTIFCSKGERVLVICSFLIVCMYMRECECLVEKEGTAVSKISLEDEGSLRDCIKSAHTYNTTTHTHTTTTKYMAPLQVSYCLLVYIDTHMPPLSSISSVCLKLYSPVHSDGCNPASTTCGGPSSHPHARGRAPSGGPPIAQRPW